MILRIARVLAAGVMLVLLIDVQPATCEGWSLPFFSSSDTKTKQNKPTPKKTVVTKTANKEPSMLDKMGTGTKSFFNKTGETLGLKKPEQKKPQYATMRSPAESAPKKTESKSWIPSMFKAEEPKKPTSVREWMETSKQSVL